MVNGYPLVMTHISPWYRWPIEIDDFPIRTSIYEGFSTVYEDLPIKNGGSFHGYVCESSPDGPSWEKKKHNVARARVFWNEFYDRWNFQDPLGTECQRRCQKELVSEVSKHGNP